MMTGKDDDAPNIREDSFLAELVPQAVEHLAEQHAEDYDAEGGQSRFQAWLAGHTERSVSAAPGEVQKRLSSAPGEVQNRRRIVVDIILLLIKNGRILLRERADTGCGDGAYEPPVGQLADRETIVETAVRVASAEAGIVISAKNVSLAHVMHDVSSGRITFLLKVSRWPGEHTSPGARWFPVGNLPTNMPDRAGVALRNYAVGKRFSTYPEFGSADVGQPSLWNAAGALDQDVDRIEQLAADLIR
jgi:8-oxo-dGTP pyrophosphatase MutT (NUDIX family)